MVWARLSGVQFRRRLLPFLVFLETFRRRTILTLKRKSVIRIIIIPSFILRAKCGLRDCLAGGKPVMAFQLNVFQRSRRCFRKSPFMRPGRRWRHRFLMDLFLRAWPAGSFRCRRTLGRLLLSLLVVWLRALPRKVMKLVLLLTLRALKIPREIRILKP